MRLHSSIQSRILPSLFYYVLLASVIEGFHCTLFSPISLYSFLYCHPYFNLHYLLQSFFVLPLVSSGYRYNIIILMVDRHYCLWLFQAVQPIIVYSHCKDTVYTDTCIAYPFLVCSAPSGFGTINAIHPLCPWYNYYWDVGHLYIYGNISWLSLLIESANSIMNLMMNTTIHNAGVMLESKSYCLLWRQLNRYLLFSIKGNFVKWTPLIVLIKSHSQYVTE